MGRFHKALPNVKSAYVTLQNFTPDLQKIYTDISAVSVTLCNSVWHQPIGTSLSTWWSIVSINVHQRCQRNQTKANKMMLMKTTNMMAILTTIMMRQTSSNCSLWSGVMTVRWNANYIQFKSLYLESGSWIFKYHQAGPDFRSIFAYAKSNMMILSLSCARQRLLSVGLVCTRYSAYFLDTFF